MWSRSMMCAVCVFCLCRWWHTENSMLLSGAMPPLAINASHLVHAPPTSPLQAFDVAGPGGAPIILAPRLPIPVGPPVHPPPPASLPPPPAVQQPSLVSFGDVVPQAPLFVHFDPFLVSQHQTPAMHHATPSTAVHHPTVPNIAYVS